MIPYDDIYNQLMYYKRNPKKLSEEQRVKAIISLLGQHPNAIELYRDMFLNNQQIHSLYKNGINNTALVKNIENEATIKTTNSSELTYSYYGYVKTITPATLNQFIDDVATRIQLENEYAKTYHIESLQEEREDELTLNELGVYF